MSYFKLFIPLKREINGSGEFCQIQRIAGGYNYNAPNSIWNFYHNSVEPNFQPHLLHYEAKLTTFLSNESGAGYYVYSNDFINFLTEFNIQKEYSVYPVELTYHQDRSDLIQDEYSALVIWKSNDHYNSIDFEDSDFYVRYKLDKTPTKIESVENLINLQEVIKENPTSKSIGATKIVLRQSFDYDMFRLGIFGGLYISERLKNAIEDNGFTGMEFKLMEHIIKKEE